MNGRDAYVLGCVAISAVKKRFRGASYLCLAMLVGVHATRASSVLPMTVSEMADAAGQIIDGVVDSVQCQWSPDGSTITTRVRFRSVVYLKGELATSADTFEIVVPGGHVGDARLRLTGAPHFEVGGRWLLFIRPTYNVYPVVGIFHGAFRIKRGPDDVAKVYDVGGGAILGIDTRGYVRSTATAPQPARGDGFILGGQSASIRGVLPVSPVVAASLSYDQFLDQIRPIIAASRDHALTQPAGLPRRIPVRATSLRVRADRTDRPSAQVDQSRRAVSPPTVPTDGRLPGGE